jgi:hypothetical protein
MRDAQIFVPETMREGAEGTWEAVLSDEEVDKEEEQQHLNPNSAEAIRKRLQRFQKRYAHVTPNQHAR